jgi:hypothetical protein
MGCSSSESEFRDEFFLELSLRMSARLKEVYLAPRGSASMLISRMAMLTQSSHPWRGIK